MEIIKPNRRGFITGLASLIAAPAIVRISSIMPVKAIPVVEEWPFYFDEVRFNRIVEKFRRNTQYGILNIKHEWINDEFKTTIIDPKDLYLV